MVEKLQIGDVSEAASASKEDTTESPVPQSETRKEATKRVSMTEALMGASNAKANKATRSSILKSSNSTYLESEDNRTAGDDFARSLMTSSSSVDMPNTSRSAMPRVSNAATGGGSRKSSKAPPNHFISVSVKAMRAIDQNNIVEVMESEHIRKVESNDVAVGKPVYETTLMIVEPVVGNVQDQDSDDEDEEQKLKVVPINARPYKIEGGFNAYKMLCTQILENQTGTCKLNL